MTLEITGATRSIRAIPAHDAFDAMHMAGWRFLVHRGSNTHWIRGSSHCVLVLNTALVLTPVPDPKMIPDPFVIATQYAPVDVMGGKLADLDRIHLAEVAQRAKTP